MIQVPFNITDFFLIFKHYNLIFGNYIFLSHKWQDGRNPKCSHFQPYHLYAWINTKVVFCYHANGVSHHIPAIIIDLLQTQREPSHLSPDDGSHYYFII